MGWEGTGLERGEWGENNNVTREKFLMATGNVLEQSVLNIQF